MLVKFLRKTYLLYIESDRFAIFASQDFPSSNIQAVGNTVTPKYYGKKQGTLAKQINQQKRSSASLTSLHIHLKMKHHAQHNIYNNV